MNKKLIYRTGLAVILAGFFFALVQSSSKSLACDRAPFESDSILIERHIREVVVGNAIEEFSDHSFNSHLTRPELDSILWADENMRITSAKMIWAPDSTFRICTVELESCGAYCNPDWMNWIHFNDGSGLVISNEQFTDVLDIIQMNENQYLIGTTSYGRSGVFSCRSYGIRLISFDKHQVIYHSIPDPRPEADPKDLSRFDVGFCTFTPSESTLAFNADNKLVSFHDYEYTDPFSEPDSISIYDGVLQYADTGFVIMKYNEKRIKYVAPE